MAINDERVAAKLEQIRGEQIARVRRRVGSATPAYVFTDESLERNVALVGEAQVREALSHPAYHAAARLLAENSIPDQMDNAVLNHALRDNGRFICGLFALYLHTRPGGLTHARLDALCEVTGTSGRTRSYAVLSYMRFLRYIEPIGQSEDGRERRYRPTQRLRDAFRLWARHRIEEAGLLYPEVAALGPRLDDEDAFDALMAALGEQLMVTSQFQKLATGPSLEVFSRRRSGLIMLWSVLLCSPETQRWPARESFQISIADVARRTGVSRPHVLRMLREGAAAGMLELGEEGRVRATDVLADELNSFIAMTLIGVADCARRALGQAAQDARSEPARSGAVA